MKLATMALSMLADRRRRTPFALLVAVVLAGCATAPTGPPPQAERLLRDDRFGPPSVTIDTRQIFAVSEPMRQYLRSEVVSLSRNHDAQDGLLKALYSRAQLKLDYDSSSTRTAGEAFEARSGNCLSLVVMTAAFAKELGLKVGYQSAYMEETWSRSGDLLVRAGHVNITLGPRLADRATVTGRNLTIDFLPPDQA